VLASAHNREFGALGLAQFNPTFIRASSAFEARTNS
jgi:hypothetical protein